MQLKVKVRQNPHLSSLTTHTSRFTTLGISPCFYKTLRKLKHLELPKTKFVTTVYYYYIEFNITIILYKSLIYILVQNFKVGCSIGKWRMILKPPILIFNFRWILSDFPNCLSCKYHVICILIGDFGVLWLRPSPKLYEISKKFKK